MAVIPRFPELSRQPMLEMPESTLDPTIRDKYDNGMVSTRARFTRVRRTFEVTIELLSPADKRKLDTFVVNKAVFGANMFLFPDKSDPQHPENLRVRFSKIPSYPKAQYVRGVLRKTAKFTLEEV